jgi:hypothetical protein
MKRPSFKRPSINADERIPRGAIAIVVIGVLATIAAALLTSGKGGGEAANLEWVQKRVIPNSKPVVVPGGGEAKMQLVDGRIQATGTNTSGYVLFRILSTLKISAGAPVSEGSVICSVHVNRAGTEIAQSSGGLRATYPRSSEKTASGELKGIYSQEVPEKVTMRRFSSHGVELATVEVDDLAQSGFTTVKGVKLEWPEYEVGTEHLHYLLPHGKNKPTIELPFYTIWKSTKAPAATISCRLEAAAGKATVETEGSLPKISPPIDEEAEEEAQEERAEAEESSGESEESEGE